MTEAEFRAAHPGLLGQLGALTAAQKTGLAAWLESLNRIEET